MRKGNDSAAIWIRLPRHKWPKSWSNIEDPGVPLEPNLCGHPVAGLLWERQFGKVLLGLGWEKGTKIGNADLCIDSKVYSYLKTVDDNEMTGRT